MKQTLSTDKNCEGYKREGDAPYGYIYSSPVNGTRPLYRKRNDITGDHLSTFHANEGDASGYVLDGITGYTFPYGIV